MHEKIKSNQIFVFSTLFKRILSNVTYDADGRVARVGALLNIWLIKFNDISLSGEKGWIKFDCF